MRRIVPLLVIALAALLLPGIAHAATASPGFDVDAATRAYLDLLSGPAREKSDAYFEGGYWLILWGALVGAAVELLILTTGLSSRLRAWAERRTKRRWLVPGLYALPYLVVSTLIALPWTIYTGYVREKQYDLMSQSFGGWFGEYGINFALGLITTPLLLMAIFAVIRRLPRLWWLAGTGVITVFLLIAVLIGPVFISPLFNTYTEMPASPLRDRIVAMAKANDIPADHIYVFDQSKQHKRISANVSGLGPTIRISLNDNLLNRSTPDEVAGVMGHEMGHYVLNHIWLIIFGFIGVILALFLFLYWTAPRLIARYGARWGVRDIADPAATPLLFALVSVAMLAVTPVMNNIVRHNENAADAFGLDAAKAPDGFAMVAMKLSEYRKISPGPIEEFLFFDHPSGENRVRRAMEWKREHVPNATIERPTKLTDGPGEAPAPR